MNAIDVEQLLMVAMADMLVVGEQVERLRECGYRCTFRRSGSRLLCLQNWKHYKPTELTIDEVFEVALDDRSTYYIYAVSGVAGTLRGIFTECA